MAANTRPYFITFAGVDRMVEAPNPASAVRHVVGAAVEELRAARGREVSEWIRSGKVIEIAGQKPDEGAPLLEGGNQDDFATVAAEFTAADARVWLDDQGATEEAMNTFADVVQNGAMSLSDWNVLSECSAFQNAILVEVLGLDPMQVYVENDIKAFREHLEEKPFGIDVVVGAIGEAKRRELFEAVQTDEPAAE